MIMERKTTFRMRFTKDEYEALATACSMVNSIFWESCDGNGNTFDLIDSENGCVLATHEQMCHTLDMLNTMCAMYHDNKGFAFNVEYV